MEPFYLEVSHNLFTQLSVDILILDSVWSNLQCLIEDQFFNAYSVVNLRYQQFLWKAFFQLAELKEQG